MKIINLKRLSKLDIDAKSVEVLLHYDKGYFSHLRSTPIEKIVQNLADNYSIKYDCEGALGYSPDGCKILGCYVPVGRKIILDQSLQSHKTKFNFVLAHELGHLVLHRNVISFEIDNEVVVDTEVSINSGRRELKNDFDFMEWQANYFASAILLPRDMFLVALVSEREKIGLSWRGRVYVDDQRVTQNDYYETIRRVSDYFEVSKTVVEIRLQELNLIEDKRSINKSSIGAIATEIVQNIIKNINSRE